MSTVNDECCSAIIPLALVLLLCFGWFPAHAGTTNPKRKPDRLLVVICDRLDLPDVVGSPILSAMMARGGAGLLSPKMEGAICSANALSTLLAGTPRRANLSQEGGGDLEIAAAGEDLLRVLNSHKIKASLWDLKKGDVRDTSAVISKTIVWAMHPRLNLITDSGWIETKPDPYLTEERRKKRIEILEAFVAGNIKQSKIMLIVLTSRNPKKYFPRLTPVILAGPDVEAGLLASPTTRQPGLVALEDIAPTILSIFNVPVPDSMTGRPMTIRPSTKAIETLTYMDKWTANRDAIVTPAVTLIGVLQGISALAAIPLLFAKSNSTVTRFSPVAHFLLLSGIATPLAIILSTPFITRGVVVTLFGIGLASLLIGGGSLAWLRCEGKALLLIAGSGTALLCLDALQGGRWTTWSVLGNAFTTGGRFYGLENGHVAYLTAYVMLALGLTHDAGKLPTSVCVVAAIVLPLLVGLSPFGANFDGMVMVPAAVSVFLIMKVRGSFGIREGLFVLSSCLLLAGMLIGFDVLFSPSDASHVGIAFRKAVLGDPGSLVPIAIRKWKANLDYIQFTPFNYVLLLAAVGLTILTVRKPPIVRDLFAKRNGFHIAMVAGLCGLWTGFFTNDSGIAILDQMVQTLAPAFVLLLLRQRRDR